MVEPWYVTVQRSGLASLVVLVIASVVCAALGETELAMLFAAAGVGGAALPSLFRRASIADARSGSDGRVRLPGQLSSYRPPQPPAAPPGPPDGPPPAA